MRGSNEFIEVSFDYQACQLYFVTAVVFLCKQQRIRLIRYMLAAIK